MASSVLWLRRDLRRDDHPALHAAHDAASGGPVVPLFVLDPVLVASSGETRLAALRAALERVDAAYDGALVVRSGDPAEVVPAVLREVGAHSVHVSGESTPYGRRRGRRVHRALEPIDATMIASGTPYAVSPGQVRKADGTPYEVFTPFFRAWRDHGWPAPRPAPRGLRLDHGLESEGFAGLPVGGEDAPAAKDADPLQRWDEFLDDLAAYATDRDRADLEATSRMSEHLKYGTVHPRTLLADVAAHATARSTGAQRFVTELAWREFYADVVWHHPESAWCDLKPTLRGLEYDDPTSDADAAARFEAWCTGTTGYPFVDAGMRQLLERGWVHNRVRMVVASFLTKDLHLWWPHGARHFLTHLRDGDVASNNHGWQWVAGTGTDAAPYFRVFNPTTQGEKFDPHGDYVRRYVPELRHIPGKAVHAPWKVNGAHDAGYPHPIIDHSEERREALARYEAARS